MYKIMVNPGHGGNDPGACGNGLREADARLLVEREDDFARAIARGITDYFANKLPAPDVVDKPTQDAPRDGGIGSHIVWRD